MTDDTVPQISVPNSFAQHYIITGSNYSESKAQEALHETLRGSGKLMYTIYTTALGNAPLHVNRMPHILTIGNAHRLHIYGENIDYMNGAVAEISDNLIRERLALGLAVSSLGKIDETRYSVPPTSEEGQLLAIVEELRKTRTIREMTNDLRAVIEGSKREEKKLVF